MGAERFRGVTVLMWVSVIRVAQVLGPPSGSFLADGTDPRVAYWASAVGMALIALGWRPLRRFVHRTPAAATG